MAKGASWTNSWNNFLKNLKRRHFVTQTYVPSTSFNSDLSKCYLDFIPIFKQILFRFYPDFLETHLTQILSRFYSDFIHIFLKLNFYRFYPNFISILFWFCMNSTQIFFWNSLYSNLSRFYLDEIRIKSE